MKDKPVGWKNEPYRHSLAARGVTTTGRKSTRVVRGGKPAKCDVCGEIIKDDEGTLAFTSYPRKWFAVHHECYPKLERQVKRGFDSSGRPIVLDIKGKGSFDGDLRISLEGAEELAPLLRSRGVAMQALSAFNSSSGTQKIEGRIKGVDVDLTVTHPGKDLYHVEGDMYYHIDRTFTRKELKGFYEKAKRLM